MAARRPAWSHDATVRSPVKGQLVEGLVVRAQSGFYVVETPSGNITAVLRGVLRKDRREEGLATLGDRVALQLLAPAEAGAGAVEATIVEVLPRKSCLRRRAPGPKGVWSRQVIVANIDQLLPVFAATAPEPNFRLLDRFLALAEMDELDSVIVMNKVDLGLSDDAARMLAIYERIGYTVLRTSTKSEAGLGALRDALHDRISAFAGPSGVGKSSLLNMLQPGLGLKVGTISAAHGKGRHTTRVGELHDLAFGGRVADTPGLRELGLWEVDCGELEWAFVEFRPYLNQCRFYDCTHIHEPGCAVLAATADGAISAERYESYRRLAAEEA